jgi:hypothetical protein
MRLLRWFIGVCLLLPLLGCNLASDIRMVPQAFTQVPGVGTLPAAGGLGISAEAVRTALQKTQQFNLSDDTLIGQPALMVALSPAGGQAFPLLAAGFSAAFIGDPANLSKIVFTIPRTDEQASVDQGLGLMKTISAGCMPAGVQARFMTWLTKYYASPGEPVQQTIIGNWLFTLSRPGIQMDLNIVPAPQ